MRLAFQVIAQGVDVTAKIADRVLSIRVTDEAGYRADTLEIALDDRDNLFERPEPGAKLAVSLGYRETFLTLMGIYITDEVVMKGPPDKISIRAKAVNLGGPIREQKTRAWHEKTLEDIVTAIADEHQLEPRIAEPLKAVAYEHLDQTDESDIHFLTRIARDHDAIASVQGETLLFVARGEGRAASGDVMPPEWSRELGHYHGP